MGRRLAFDAAHGRLWVVCARCERWNLTPLDQRWEAVEDCDRRFREARKRVTSEHIGLARLDEGLELVRIGEPLRPEFAAWRYGDQFGRRRRRNLASGAAVAVGVGVAALGAATMGAASLGGFWAYRAFSRWAADRRARQLVARVPLSPGNVVTVRHAHLAESRLNIDAGRAEGWRLELPHTGGKALLDGHEAYHAMSLILPTINGTGGTASTVRRAVKHLEVFDDPLQYVRAATAFAAHPTRPGALNSLPGLPADVRLAVEMAVNEESERCALEGELWLLELAWREAEEIAAIADDLTTPAEVHDQLETLRKRLSPSDDRPT